VSNFRGAVHPLPTQRKIAAILSAYDDLIENNTRRIAILEQMAQALYREWFVDFRFPGHEQHRMVESPLGLVPEGWVIKSLFNVADVTYGFPFKSNQFTTQPTGMRVIRIRDIKPNSSDTYTTEEAESRYIVDNGDLLVGMDGGFHMGKWAGGQAYLNQRVVRFRPKGHLSPYYLLLALRAPIKHFEATIVGTTVSHLSDKDLRSIFVIVPDVTSSAKMMALLDDAFRQELALRLRNANLRRTRDLLLPKLISGDVDVTRLEISGCDMQAEKR
jgi:type I restriction enzyme S subunit